MENGSRLPRGSARRQGGRDPGNPPPAPGGQAGWTGGCTLREAMTATWIGLRSRPLYAALFAGPRRSSRASMHGDGLASKKRGDAIGPSAPLLATLAQTHTGERVPLDSTRPRRSAVRFAPGRSRDRLDARARPAPPGSPSHDGDRPRVRRRGAAAHRARERFPQSEAQRDAPQERPPRRLAQPALALGHAVDFRVVVRADGGETAIDPRVLVRARFARRAGTAGSGSIPRKTIGSCTPTTWGRTVTGPKGQCLRPMWSPTADALRARARERRDARGRRCRRDRSRARRASRSEGAPSGTSRATHCQRTEAPLLLLRCRRCTIFRIDVEDVHARRSRPAPVLDRNVEGADLEPRIAPARHLLAWGITSIRISTPWPPGAAQGRLFPRARVMSAAMASHCA